MTPYVILVVCLVITGFLEVNNVALTNKSSAFHSTVSRRAYALIPLGVLLFIGIFREVTVGHDAVAYDIYYWAQLDRLSWGKLLTDFSNDNGFYLILKAISVFTNDYWAARAILFVITFGIYYSVIHEESPYPSTTLLLFIGLGNLSLMLGIFRQALAGGICLHAYKHICHDAKWKCFTLILIATTIHKSAMLCIAMLMIQYLRMKKFTGIKLICLSILAYLSLMFIIPLITLLYADGRYAEAIDQEGGFGMLSFMIVIIVLAGHLIRITDSAKDYEMGFLFNLSCGALLIQVGALQWSLLNRMASYFSIYWSILLTKLICKLPRRERILYWIIIAILFAFMFFYQLSEVEMFELHKF